jgi:hypothetical protein
MWAPIVPVPEIMSHVPGIFRTRCSATCPSGSSRRRRTRCASGGDGTAAVLDDDHFVLNGQKV